MLIPLQLITKAVVYSIKFVCLSLEWKEHLLKSYLLSDHCGPVALLCIEYKVPLCCLAFVFPDIVSLCSPGWPQAHGNVPATASQMLGWQIGTTMLG